MRRGCSLLLLNAMQPLFRTNHASIRVCSHAGHAPSFRYSTYSSIRKALAPRSQRRNSDSSTAAGQESDVVDDLPPLAEVYTSMKNVDIDQLAAWADRGKLNLRPEYQRGMVWDLKTASHLVVTVLEARIMPPIFLEEDASQKYLVMDGKQRLTSLLTFMKGKGLEDERWDSAPIELDVNEEECHPAWKKVTFDKLPPDRKEKFRSYTVSCIIIEHKTDRDVVFSIYRDINSGGVKHSPQQIRKVAFHGQYARMLDRLARNPDFLQIQGRSEPDADKDLDRELALRFFAMKRSRSEFATPMWKFLNSEMKDFRDADEAQLHKLEEIFCKTAALVWTLFGPDACRDVSQSSSSRAASSSKKVPPDLKLDPNLWDAVMVAVSEELQLDSRRERELKMAKDQIQISMRQLLGVKDFRDSLNSRSKKGPLQRVLMVQRMLQDAMQGRRLDSKRAFGPTIKQQLINAAKTTSNHIICAECHQRIEDWELQTAEVDHVMPWSKGGGTTVQNAQLLHMSCNRSKGNRLKPAASAVY